MRSASSATGPPAPERLSVGVQTVGIRKRAADTVELPSGFKASVAGKRAAVAAEFALGTAVRVSQERETPATDLLFRPVTFGYGGRAVGATNGAERWFAGEQGSDHGTRRRTKTIRSGEQNAEV